MAPNSSDQGNGRAGGQPQGGQQQAWQRPWTSAPAAAPPPAAPPAAGRPAPGLGQQAGGYGYGAPAPPPPGYAAPPPTQYLKPIQPPTAAPPYAAPPQGPPTAPLPAQGASQDFGDEATEVYGDDGAQGGTQVKGRLAVLEGELAGHWFTLLGSEIRIGRADDNHMVIPDLAVSRHHVRMVYSQGAYRLQDSSSGNGCYVNGIRIEEATLRDGDQIEIGRTIMEFLTTERAPGPVRFRRGQFMLGPAAPQPGSPPRALPPMVAPPLHGAAGAGPPRAAVAPPSMDFPAPGSYSGAGATPMNRAARGGLPAWALAVFGILGLAILGLLALVVYYVVGGWGPPTPKPYELAQAAYKSGQWDQALELLRAVPSDSEQASDAQRAVDTILENRKRYEQASALKGSDDLEGARTRLSEIPEGEPYASEAATLLAEVEREIAAREAAKPKGPEVEPGSPLDRALAPYRQERITVAIQELKRISRKDPLAAELLGKMNDLLEALRVGRGKLKKKEYEAALPRLEEARVLDLELGGALQESIVPDVVEASVAGIEAALKAKDYAQAGEAMRTLKKIAPDQPETMSAARLVSNRAAELVVEARQLREVTPQRAKRQLKQVLQLVGPEDPSHTKAQQLLGKPADYR